MAKSGNNLGPIDLSTCSIVCNRPSCLLLSLVVNRPSSVVMSMSSLQYTIIGFQEYVFSCVKLSPFLQYLLKYSLLSSRPNKSQGGSSQIPPTREDELAKQLKYQQHQIDTLVGQIKNLVSAVQSTRVSTKGAMAGGYGRQPQNTWRGGSRGSGLPTQTPLQTTPQPRARNPQLDQGAGHIFKCW